MPESRTETHEGDTRLRVNVSDGRVTAAYEYNDLPQGDVAVLAQAIRNGEVSHVILKGLRRDLNVQGRTFDVLELSDQDVADGAALYDRRSADTRAEQIRHAGVPPVTIGAMEAEMGRTGMQLKELCLTPGMVEGSRTSYFRELAEQLSVDILSGLTNPSNVARLEELDRFLRQAELTREDIGFSTERLTRATNMFEFRRETAVILHGEDANSRFIDRLHERMAEHGLSQYSDIGLDVQQVVAAQKRYKKSLERMRSTARVERRAVA
jgi:hypothetical protein